MHGGIELALRTSLIPENAIRPLTSQPTVGVSVNTALNHNLIKIRCSAAITHVPRYETLNHTT
jgi:hypothetical protein